MNNQIIDSNLKMLRSLASDFSNTLNFWEKQQTIHQDVSETCKIYRNGRITSLQECLEVIEEYIYDLEETQNIVNDVSSALSL